ncbi:MAG: branched-chain amino acid ABC transporter permease [Armatimonadetes bacterium]|nr:branched-chain amino acid ABC transporter permease [Armatimonadota bacterium]
MKFWGTRLLSIIAALGFCFGLQQVLLGTGNEYFLRLGILAGLYVTLSVSLNLINGICGQFSIGHAAFYHIGAYTTGFISVRMYQSAGVNELVWLAILLPIGMIAAAFAGLIVGLPSLKLRGDYLAIVTLGFGEIIRIVTTNIDAVGASFGMEHITKINPAAMVIFVWMLAIVCMAVSRNLLKTVHGLPFLAVREDEAAAMAMGVNVTKTKVTAFVIGSAFAGGAGVLFAHFEGFITPDHFKMEVSFIILTMVVLGGTGSITGSALAAIVLFGIPEALRLFTDADGNQLQVTGAGLIASMIASGLVVAAYKQFQLKYHGSTLRKVGLYFGAIAVAIPVQMLLRLVLKQIPAIAPMTFNVSDLRMVIFAASLIVIMLLRPQGVLAHHEFSWDWVRRLLKRDRKVAQP